MKGLWTVLCAAALAGAAFAAEAEARGFAPSSVPGEKWKDLQLKVVKPKGEHDLLKALAQAKKERKFTFVQMSRANCTNSMQLWHLLADGRVKLPGNFVYADLSRDDDEMRAAFEERFSLDEDGFWLPYVVIVGPDGVQLASCAGKKSPQEYNALIEKAVRDYAAFRTDHPEAPEPVPADAKPAQPAPAPQPKAAPEAPKKAFAESPVPTPDWCRQIPVKKLPGEHDLNKAIEAAKAQGKFLFVQYGRTNCTNCQKVWNMLGDGRVKLPADMLYADVSCDDDETRMTFEATFSVTDDGYLYPYVVIMGPDGSQLAFKSGLGTPESYNAMIKQAKADYATPLP